MDGLPHLDPARARLLALVGTLPSPRRVVGVSIIPEGPLNHVVHLDGAVAVVENRFSASWAVVPLAASSAAGAHSFPRGPYSAYKVNYKMQSKTKRNARQF